MNEREEEKGQMTVEEAGQKGGQRVRELVQEGEEAEMEGGEEMGGKKEVEEDEEKEEEA